jgi:hypothetical protein
VRFARAYAYKLRQFKVDLLAAACEIGAGVIIVGVAMA